MDVIAELERIVAERDEERRVAELGHAGAMAALRKVKADREAAARQRAALKDGVVQAATLAEAAAARLGDVRGSAAATRREISSRADRVADGDDKSAASIARLQDSAQMQEALVAAHERRATEMAAAVGRAEAALRAHDVAQEDAAGRELERLMAVEATGIDQLLGRVAGRAERLGDVIEARRAGGVREGWAYRLQHGGSRHGAMRDAFASALRALEPQFKRLGSSTPAATVAGLVAEAVGSWAGGRGAGVPAPPAEAA